MPASTVLLIGIALGAFLLAAVEVGLFYLLCWWSRPLDGGV